MSQELEQRITRLEEEVKHLQELVGRFTFEQVDGNVSIQVEGGVSGLTVDAEGIGGDLLLNAKDVQGLSIETEGVGNDVSVSLNSAGGVNIEAEGIGNDLSVHSNGATVNVSAENVGGGIG